MSRKTKGISAERELVHLFWNNGWGCIRVAGSGNSQFPSVDVIAGNSERKLAIECKSVGSTQKYFSTEEIEQLKKFSTSFGAEPWIGIRFDRVGWYFIMLEDLKETKSQYVVSVELAKAKGLIFDELIQKGL